MRAARPRDQPESQPLSLPSLALASRPREATALWRAALRRLSPRPPQPRPLSRRRRHRRGCWPPWPRRRVGGGVAEDAARTRAPRRGTARTTAAGVARRSPARAPGTTAATGTGSGAASGVATVSRRTSRRLRWSRGRSPRWAGPRLGRWRRHGPGSHRTSRGLRRAPWRVRAPRAPRDTRGRRCPHRMATQGRRQGTGCSPGAGRRLRRRPGRPDRQGSRWQRQATGQGLQRIRAAASWARLRTGGPRCQLAARRRGTRKCRAGRLGAEGRSTGAGTWLQPQWGSGRPCRRRPHQ